MYASRPFLKSRNSVVFISSYFVYICLVNGQSKVNMKLMVEVNEIPLHDSYDDSAGITKSSFYFNLAQCINFSL